MSLHVPAGACILVASQYNMNTNIYYYPQGTVLTCSLCACLSVCYHKNAVNFNYLEMCVCVSAMLVLVRV